VSTTTIGLVALLPAAREVAAVALDVAPKATVLLLLAYAAHAAAGPRRALLRSALWNAALVGLLALAVAVPASPRLRLAVLPPRETVAIAISTPAPRAVTRPEATVAVPLPLAELVPEGEIATAPAHALDLATTAPPAARRWPDLATLAPGLYAAGLLLALVRLGVAMAAVRGLRRRAVPVADPAWLAAFAAWRERLGIAREVALLRSDEVTVPVVVGATRPAVILPTALAGPPRPGMADAVLVHELAHVRRGDYAWNLVLRLVRALYWPHPLAWPLGRVVGAVRERACDDLCVGALGGPEGYRAALLDVASGLVRRPGPALGMAMARTSALGRRLEGIRESRGASRCLLRGPSRAAVAAVVLGLAGLVGSVELARATARARAAEPAAPADGPPAFVEVVVRAKDTGRPLEGARVSTSADLAKVLLRTDGRGVARVDLAGRTFRDDFVADVWADGYVQQRHSFFRNPARGEEIPARVEVELLPGEETLGGKVVDEAGQPIAGVKVAIWGYLGAKREPHELAWMVDATTGADGAWRCRSFRNMKFAYLYLSHPDYLADGQGHPRRHGRPTADTRPEPDERPMAALRDFTDVQVLTRGAPVGGRVVDAQDRPVAGAEVGWLEADDTSAFHDDLPTTTTDADGRFAFPHARPGRLMLQVKAAGHAPALQPAEAKAGSEPATIRLGPPRAMVGRVVDTRGEPIPDAFVNVDTWRGSRALGVYLKTDAEGRFRWDDAPVETVLLNASRTGYEGVFREKAAPGEAEVRITLRRALLVTGKVRDAATKRPIDQVEVEVGTPDPATGAIAWGSQPRVFASQGQFQATLNAETAPSYRLRFRARGFAPFESREFRADEGRVEEDVALSKSDQPAATVAGAVRLPDGSPLAGATVAVTYGMGGESRLPIVHIEGGALSTQFNPDLVTATTDAQGRFTVGREPDPDGRFFAVLVVHPDAYAEVLRKDFEADPTIVARPWGRIEGTVREDGRPVAGAAIGYFADRLGNRDVPAVVDQGRATTDAEGRFVLPRVVPGDVRVGGNREVAGAAKVAFGSTLVEVRPGETARVALVRRGRPVVARIALPEGFDPAADYTTFSRFHLESARPTIPYPKELFGRRDGSMVDWAKRWWSSAEGRAYRRDNYGENSGSLQPDGSLRIEDVPPGEYRLRVTYSADRPYGLAAPERIAYAARPFVMPAIPGGRSDEPLDLGVLRPFPRLVLAVGTPAPDFAVPTLDGRTARLADSRGKVLVLVFGSTWSEGTRSAIPELKALHERFGEDERFAMLGLNLDADREAVGRFAKEQGVSWDLGLLGDWNATPVPDAYRVGLLPTTFVIGPDGKVAAAGLLGDHLAAAVARALDAP
jgi:beta-lactamase regulating signal transducer with metallopeptidase domain/peroxiredoxin